MPAPHSLSRRSFLKIGSLGAAYYLQNNLAELFAATQDAAFSMIIRSSYDGLHIIASDLVAGAVIW